MTPTLIIFRFGLVARGRQECRTWNPQYHQEPVVLFPPYHRHPSVHLVFPKHSGGDVIKTDSKNLHYKWQYRREAAGLTLHWILKSVFLFCYMPSFLTGLVFFLISEFLGGFGIAIVVFLNHYPLDKVEESVWHRYGFCAGQILTTMNIQRGLITDAIIVALPAMYYVDCIPVLQKLWPPLSYP